MASKQQTTRVEERVVTYLQIKTLGKLQLQYGERHIADFPTHHVAELLAFLVLHPDLSHNRLKLIELLWPDCAEQQGRGRLNTAVWRLRLVFDTLCLASEEVLMTSRDWIDFRAPAGMQTDFETLKQWERMARHEENLARREGWLQQAVNLYQGDFCEGIYADWCMHEREKLARLHLRTLGQLMHCYIQSEAYEEAIDTGQQILQVDPLREEVHRALMRCYRQLGRYAQAVRQFHICSRLLHNELQLPPMPATVALFTQITTERNSGITQAEDNFQPLATELQEAVFQLQTASRNLDKLLVKYESS
jgi:DNA-binding SARP family transcriptional activator